MPVLVLTAATGACDDPSAPGLDGTSWRLVEVNGSEVPHNVSSWDGGENTYHARVTARSVDFLSGDSAVYAWASDVAGPDESGELVPLQWECTSQTVGYSRDGDRLILARDPMVLTPGPGSPTTEPAPLVYDTLYMTGDHLVQYEVLAEGQDESELRYAEGTSEPACGPAAVSVRTTVVSAGSR